MLSVGPNDYAILFLGNSTFLTAYIPSQYVDMVICNMNSVIILCFFLCPFLLFFISFFLVTFEAQFRLCFFIVDLGRKVTRHGGRKFAFKNVPPTGCMPFLRIQTGDGNCHRESVSYVMHTT